MRRFASHLPSSFLVLALLPGCGGGDTEGEADPPGREETTETEVLEAGAVVIQDVTPVDQVEIYVVGFHPSAEDPSIQMESHHYCHQVNEDFAQCVLYDGNTEDANLHGIEYIVSERLFEQLPEEERQYWHPHNYEILSGQLRGPGLPEVAERELMESKINSYGKTWHVWMTGVHGREPDAMPLGEPHLAWSFSRDGEAMEGMVEARDRRMDLSTADARERRSDLAELAEPQWGVDRLRDFFPDAGGQPPGVEARDTARGSDASGADTSASSSPEAHGSG